MPMKLFHLHPLQFRFLSLTMTIFGIWLSCHSDFFCSTIQAEEVTQEEVLQSIEKATNYLLSNQTPEGSWQSDRHVGDSGRNPKGVGSTGLTLLALLNAGLDPGEPQIKKGLEWLRNAPDTKYTYSISLKIMALCAAKQPQKDLTRIQLMADKLEKWQNHRGGWWYGPNNNNDDTSNSQYAILALRDAVEAGATVERGTWEKALNYWVQFQTRDGGWPYLGPFDDRSPIGSMTTAGISSYVICRSMLQPEDKLNADGTPVCCGEEPQQDPLEKAKDWMAKYFSITQNPQARNRFFFYYLYGLERAGRLSGTRFFGDHDWYREGADFLVKSQSQRHGHWKSNWDYDDPKISTAFCLLFLSKGMSPVLFNKLRYGKQDPIHRARTLTQSWNKHPNDISHLTSWISSLKKWPKLMSWQVIDINRSTLDDLLQAPVLHISGDREIDIPEEKIKLLRKYLDQGGLIFATPGCDPIAFGASFRELVKQIYLDEGISLKPISPSHAVYRSEFLLSPDSVELHGTDFGCRTTIIYCPDDLGCLWELSSKTPPPNRTNRVKLMINRANQIGANVAAYATGREPPRKNLDALAIEEENLDERIKRGLIQIPKLKHAGNWDTAPKALHNLLLALNETAGLTANTDTITLSLQDDELRKYPMVYMHGRSSFKYTKEEIERLRKYLDYGGMLFADACCSNSNFGDSFKELVKQLYPEQELKRIPVDHPIFSSEVGYDITRVRRRQGDQGGSGALADNGIVLGEPFLEAIDIEGRLPVIYSKYDISCALQKQSAVSCAGYIPEDATRIGVNVVMYSMMQDFNFPDEDK